METIEITDVIKTILTSVTLIIAVGSVVLLLSTMIINETKSVVEYGGFENDIIVFEYNNSTYIYTYQNDSSYTSYVWNRTAWEVDKLEVNKWINGSCPSNDITEYNLTMQDLMDKSDWSWTDGY